MFLQLQNPSPPEELQSPARSTAERADGRVGGGSAGEAAGTTKDESDVDFLRDM